MWGRLLTSPCLSNSSTRPMSSSVVSPVVSRRGYARKPHNPGHISYSAEKWQTKLKDVPRSKQNASERDPDYKLRESPYPPLNVAYGNIDNKHDASIEVPVTKITTLGNGIKVASEESYSPLCAIGVVINAGIRHEPPLSKPGLSMFAEGLAYRTTLNRSAKQMQQELEGIGALVSTFSDRDSIIFSLETLRENMGTAMELLADTIRRPSYSPEEVQEYVQRLHYEMDDIHLNRLFMMEQLLFSTAYPNPGLGRTLLNSWPAIKDVSQSDLLTYHSQFFVPKNITIGGASVNHEEFVSEASLSFAPMTAGPDLPPTPPAQYSGGIEFVENKMAGEDDTESFYVAFESGGWLDHHDTIVIAVVQKLMGGGSSFSAGGPGKGMHSRLYRAVLNQYWWMESAECIAQSFSDTGLFGMKATTKGGERFSELVEVVCQQLVSLLYAPTVTPDDFSLELERAKNQLKSNMFINLEHRTILLDDVARQVSIYGKRYSGHELVKEIESVTSEDVSRVLLKVMSTTPTIIGSSTFDAMSKVSKHMIPDYFANAVKEVAAAQAK
eukprot:TRINITY_DN2241_c0_g1_i1.p1 TRINITY_DN2241_c0_g1~~TRINITY_DN2241_c0_g1_i1.p1  ORF type:complete len:561 (+),score=106.18 TRINITY_DN2241_c0_g1_i1:23-1684(+)